MAKTSLAELAVEIRMAASREAASLNALEYLAATTGHDAVKTTLASVKLSGARLGEAYELIRALIPHEKVIRELAVREEMKHEDFSDRSRFAWWLRSTR